MNTEQLSPAPAPAPAPVDQMEELAERLGAEHEQEGLTAEDFERLMSGQPLDAPAPEPQVEPQTEPAQVDPSPTPPTEPEPAVPPVDPIVQLTNMVAQLQRQLDEARAGQVQEQAPQAPAPAPSGYQRPSYSYKMPDDLVEHLSSEDSRTRATALSFLVSQIGQAVHSEVMKEVLHEINNASARMRVEMESQATANDIRRDFYGAFPQLNKPEYHPIVAMVSQQVMREMNANEWNQHIRNAVGQRVLAMLRMNAQGEARPKQAVKASTSAPPPFVGGRTRPAAGAIPNPQLGMIAETFDF